MTPRTPFFLLAPSIALLLAASCGGSKTTPVAPQPIPAATPVGSAPIPDDSRDAGAPAKDAAPTAAGGITVIAHPASASASLAVDDQNVYFVDESDGTLNSAPKGGGIVSTIFTAPSAPVTATNLALDGSSIYWILRAPGDSGGSILKIDKSGQTTLPLARKIKEQLKSIAADSSNVYWANDAFIMKVSTSGGQATAVGGGGGKNPTSVAVDDKSIYWTADGFVFSLGKSGGVPTVFAHGQDNADHMTLDATNAYWTSGMKIMRKRMPRP